MKRTFLYLLLLFLGCTSTSLSYGKLPSNIQNKLIGIWTYSYSIIDDSRTQLNVNKHYPAYKIVFTNCSDSLETDMAPSIKLMRKQNILENIKCETYLTDTTINALSYPTGKYMKDSTLLWVNDYGTKHKDEYFIESVTPDSLLIYTNRYYTIRGKSYKHVRHVYKKQLEFSAPPKK